LRDKKHFTIQTAPDRYEIPKNWICCYDNLLKGKMILIKRTDNNGCANILGNNLVVDKLWVNRLVHAEINIDKKIINFYRLRRREPNDQPLIKTVKYSLQ
jgi:hypothetical protein